MKGSDLPKFLADNGLAKAAEREVSVTYTPARLNSRYYACDVCESPAIVYARGMTWCKRHWDLHQQANSPPTKGSR